MTLQQTLVRRMPPGERQRPEDTVDATERATAALFARIHDGSTGETERRRRRAQIIELNLPFATRLAHRYCRRGQYTEDLEQVAALALVKAVDGFDPARGKPFFGYAVPTIVGELKRYFRDNCWDVHVSRRLQERHLELNRARATLTQRLRRSPTVPELSAELQLTEEEVVDALAAGWAYDADSLNAKATSDEDSCELQELFGAEDPVLVSACDRLAVRDLLHLLPERERYIITQYFFGNATQEQIAAVLGMSQMNVSRMLRRILQRLRRQLDDDPDAVVEGSTTASKIVMRSAGRYSLVVAVHGDVDDVAAARLRDALVEAVVHRRPRRLVVDLRDGGAVDVAAVRALLAAYRACGHGGTRLSVVNAAEQVYRLLCRLGIVRLFPCRPLERRPAAVVEHPDLAPARPAGRTRWTPAPRRQTDAGAAIDICAPHPAPLRAAHATPASPVRPHRRNHVPSRVRCAGRPRSGRSSTPPPRALRRHPVGGRWSRPPATAVERPRAP